MSSTYSYGLLRPLMIFGFVCLAIAGIEGLLRGLGIVAIGLEIHWAPAIYGFFLVLAVLDLLFFLPLEAGARFGRSFVAPLLAAFSATIISIYLRCYIESIVITSLILILSTVYSVREVYRRAGSEVMAHLYGYIMAIPIALASTILWLFDNRSRAGFETSSIPYMLLATTPYIAKIASMEPKTYPLVFISPLAILSAFIASYRGYEEIGGTLLAVSSLTLAIGSMLGSRGPRGCSSIVSKIYFLASNIFLLSGGLILSIYGFQALDAYIHLIDIGHGLSSIYIMEIITTGIRLTGIPSRSSEEVGG